MSKAKSAPASVAAPAPSAPANAHAGPVLPEGPALRVPLAPSLAGLTVAADAIVRDLIAQIVEQAAENGRLRAVLADAPRERRHAATTPPTPDEVKAAVADVGARIVRLVEQVAEGGVVPDDLPAGPLRDALHAVAALRGSVASSQAIAEAARAEALAAQAAAKRHHEELQAARAATPAPADPALAEEVARLTAAVKAAHKERDGAKRAAELAKAEVAHAKGLAAKAEAADRAASEARAALALVAEAAGCEADTAPGELAHRIAERLAAAPAPAKAPALEPPPMRETAWTELSPGELAIDRRGLRRLQELYDGARTGGPEPSDPERRVLALRVGDRVAWLRGDGLWADGTPFEEGQLFKPARFREWASPRALVIAEGLSGDPGEVARAFRTWHEAATLCLGLEAALADDPPATAE